MKCENCGSERLQRDIRIITKLGWEPGVTQNDPLADDLKQMGEQHTAGWRGQVTCLECGSESEWYGDYVNLNGDEQMGSSELDEVETELLYQAHECMRLVAPPDQTTIPEICPCRACGGLPNIREVKKGRVWIEHKCGENNSFLALCANQRQGILAWNKRQEKKADE